MMTQQLKEKQLYDNDYQRRKLKSVLGIVHDFPRKDLMLFKRDTLALNAVTYKYKGHAIKLSMNLNIVLICLLTIETALRTLLGLIVSNAKRS